METTPHILEAACEWRAGDVGNFLQRHAFLEAKHQGFAVFACNLLHAGRNLFVLFALNRGLECGSLRARWNAE